MNASKIKLFVFILLLAGLVLPGCVMQQQPAELPTQAPLQAVLNPGAFGEGVNDLLALEVFQDYLYAGPYSADHGARISRTNDGNHWEFASEEAFSYPLPAELTGEDFQVIDFQEFDGQLYVIMNWFTIEDPTWTTHPIQVWRTRDGMDWENVVEDGFGLTGFYAGTEFVVYKEMLYITEMSFVGGFEIWRSPSGDKGDWTQVAEEGLGCRECAIVHGITVFNDKLFVVSGGWLVNWFTFPIRLWYSQDGENWIPVTTNGFDNTATSPSNLVVYQDYLYLGMASLGVMTEDGGMEGARIWRSQDGISWEPVSMDGIQDYTKVVNQLFVFDGKLYANLSQLPEANTYYLDEDDTWKLAEGLNHGFYNEYGNPMNQVAEFKHRLFYGKFTEQFSNESTGQVWSWCLDCE